MVCALLESASRLKPHVPFLGPRGKWLFGSIKDFAIKGDHIAYQDWGKEYGPVFKVSAAILCHLSTYLEASVNQEKKCVLHIARF